MQCVAVLELRAVLKEQVDDGRAGAISGCVERRSISVAVDVGVGAMVEEPFHHRFVVDDEPK